MSQDKIDSKCQHVSVVVDVERYSRQTLETAVYFACTLGAQLDCIFVEDERLLKIADLPFTREVLMHNASEQAVDSQTLSRALVAYSRQVQQTLAQLANSHHLHFTFQTVRAHSYHALLDITSSARLMLFGSRAFALPNKPADTDNTQLKSNSSELCVLITGADTDQRLLGTAISLAEREHCKLKVYMQHTDKLLSRQIQTLINSYRGQPSIESIESLNAYLESIQQSPASSTKPRTAGQTLILPQSALDDSESLINHLLDQPGWRLLLVS